MKSLPSFLQRREGTTYYEELHAVKQQHIVNLGFLQRLLYGTPEHVLLAQVPSTKSSKVVKGAEKKDGGKKDEEARDEELSIIVDDAVETVAGSGMSAKVRDRT